MDKYERLHKIGEGAYGEVFKCVHRGTGEAVAIKRFTDSDEDPNIRKMCTRELGMLKVCVCVCEMLENQTNIHTNNFCSILSLNSAFTHCMYRSCVMVTW